MTAPNTTHTPNPSNGQRTNAPSAPRTPRMTLAAVTRGVSPQPLRVVIYGPGGVGKSTFGAQAPKPIFLGAEDGSALLDVARFPQPETWGDALDAIRTLATEAHDFGTLVIDSADWMEPLCWAHVCQSARKPDIEAFGFGKGYVAALEEWRKLLAAIEGLRRAKRMHIVVIAHSIVATYKNPEGDDYDRFALKLHKGAAGILTEWCDELCYGSFRTHSSKVDPKGTRGRGYGSERVLYTERRAAFDAKSRHGLPPEMPLSWDEFFADTQRGAGELMAKLHAEANEALSRLDALAPEIAQKARAHVDAAGDPARLSMLLNTIFTRIAEHTPASTPATDNA